MIGIHTSGAAISPTLLPLERYGWLHKAHSRFDQSTVFTHDFLKLMLRYHPRSISIDPQDKPVKLANQWADLPPPRHAIKSAFLTTTELFDNPLNCSTTDTITYCSAFPDDQVFGAVLNAFLFR